MVRARWALAALLALGTQLAVTPARAGSGDGEARRLVTEAMEEDYMETKFSSAERKLKKALFACTEKGCKTRLHAKVWGYLGVVYANGVKDQASAIVAFQEMLKLDPNAKPDANFSSPEVDAAFDGAKSAAEVEEKQRAAEQERAAAAERKRAAEEERKRRAEEEQQRKAEEEAERAAEQAEARRKAEEEEKLRQAELAARRAAEEKAEAERQKCEVDRVAEMDETPWVEQALFYPIPVYVELGELKLPEGASVKKVEVEWSAPGVGERRKTVLPALGEGYGGYLPCEASRQPGDVTYTVTAYNQCGNAVAMVGADEPRTVSIKQALDNKQPHLPNELPPEMCREAAPGDALTCEADDDCPGGARCTAGVCKAAGKTVVDPSRITPRKNRFALVISPDFALVNGSDVCSKTSRADGQFTCFDEDGNEYTDQPNKDSAGAVTTLGVGTPRLSLGYERVVSSSLVVGGRAGVTLLGPDRDDGKGVLPIHVEGRAAWFLGRDPFARRALRPYAHLAAGVAESAARAGGVKVADGQGRHEFVVWQKGGPVVVGLGFGLELPLGDAGGLIAELALRQMLPAPLTTTSISVGYGHGL